MESSSPNAQHPLPHTAHLEAYGSPPDYEYEQSYPVSRTAYQTKQVQPFSSTVSLAPVIAELPAPLPPAPRTTTPLRQLNQDELLAHKLQQLEVKEAKRRSSSLLPHRPLHAPATSNPDLRQGYLEQPRQLRASSYSISSLAPYGPESFNQPHSRSLSTPLSQLAPYGPDSFARPISLDPSSLPEVVSGPGPAVFDVGSDPPADYMTQSTLPEVVFENEAPQVMTPQLHPTAPPPPDHAATSKYLEQHRQVPYPPQWVLAPSVATFYGASLRAPKSDSWIDAPAFQQWHTVRRVEYAKKPSPPAFEFTFKSKGGTFRDPQHSWSMTSTLEKEKSKKTKGDWRYNLRMNSDNKTRKAETLYPAKGRDTITTYLHAPNYDSLRFVGPDGRLYLWVSHAQVTAMHGSRYDALRHALFVATHSQSDPLYGDIVADHAYWDGFVDHNEAHLGHECLGCGASPINGLRWECRSCLDHTICEICRGAGSSVKHSCSFTLVNLPDEALHIRSSSVDPALVIATLQILKDWEMHTMRREKQIDPKGFEFSEIRARRGDLGRLSYWKSQDFDKKGEFKMDGQVFGTVVKVRELASVVAEGSNPLGDAGTDQKVSQLSR